MFGLRLSENIGRAVAGPVWADTPGGVGPNRVLVKHPVWADFWESVGGGGLRNTSAGGVMGGCGGAEPPRWDAPKS